MHFGTALILVHAVLEAIKEFHEKSDTIQEVCEYLFVSRCLERGRFQ
jgi:hypothetical protein